MRHTFADGGTFCLLVVAQSRSQQLPASIPPAKSFSDRKQALRVDKKIEIKIFNQRCPGFQNYRRPFGPQPQVCWTFVMSLRFLRALP